MSPTIESDDYSTAFRNNAMRLLKIARSGASRDGPEGQTGMRPTKPKGWADPQDVMSRLTPIDIESLDPIEKGGPTMHSSGKRAFIKTEDSHVMAIGSTGSRKTTAFIIPSVVNIARSGEPMLIVDPKGELHKRTSGILAECGYDVKVLNIWDPLRSNRWNPFLNSYRNYRSGDPELMDRAIGEVKIIVECLRPLENTKDPYWEEAARQVLTGLILSMYELCWDPSQVNFKTLAAMKSELVTDSKECNAFDEYYNGLDSGSLIRRCFDIIKINASSTAKCIIAVLDSTLFPLTSRDSMMHMLSGEEEVFSDMTEKTAYYVIAPDNTGAYNRMISLFTKLLYNDLCHRAQAAPEGRLPHRANFILDEFANLNLDEILNMFTAARSRGIRMLVVIQSYSQLVERYGPHKGEALLSQCDLVFLTSREMDLLKRLSDMVGDFDGKRLVTPAELQRLKPGRALVLSGRENPYLCDLPSVFDYPSRDPMDLPEKPSGRLEYASFSGYGGPFADSCIEDLWDEEDDDEGFALDELMMAFIPDVESELSISDIIERIALVADNSTSRNCWIDKLSENILMIIPYLDIMGISSRRMRVDERIEKMISAKVADYENGVMVEYSFDGATYTFVCSDSFETPEGIYDDQTDRLIVLAPGTAAMTAIALILALFKHIRDHREGYGLMSIAASNVDVNDFDRIVDELYAIMNWLSEY